MWSQRWGGLRWVDMLAGDILTLSASGVGRRHVGRIAAALRPRLQGGAVIGVERGFALEDADGTLTYLDPLWVTGQLRMNEGACDPDGRFYGGSMGHDHQRGAGALYRLDPDCSARMVLDHVTIFNGLGLEPGWRSRLLHRHRDAPRRRVRLRAGHGADRAAPFIEIPADVGRPGGLTVDAEGGVWIAVNRGGAVRRYTAGGVLDQVFEMPARKVTLAPSAAHAWTSCSSRRPGRISSPVTIPWPGRCSVWSLACGASRCASSPGDVAAGADSR